MTVWEQAARASMHPTAVAILELVAAGRPEGVPGWTPRRLADRLDVPFHQVLHHVRKLVARGLLVEIGRGQVPGKGVVEHFYGLGS